MDKINYNCGNGLEFEIMKWGAPGEWMLHITYCDRTKTIGGSVSIPLKDVDTRDAILKEIQTFADTAQLRIQHENDADSVQIQILDEIEKAKARNAKDEV